MNNFGKFDSIFCCRWDKNGEALLSLLSHPKLKARDEGCEEAK